jgi:hypothetical protein
MPQHNSTTLKQPLSAPTNFSAAATAASINPLTLPPPPFQHCHHRQRPTTAITAFTIKDNTPHVTTATAIATVGQPTIKNHSPHIATNTISTLPLQIPN